MPHESAEVIRVNVSSAAVGTVRAAMYVDDFMAVIALVAVLPLLLPTACSGEAMLLSRLGKQLDDFGMYTGVLPDQQVAAVVEA